MSADRGTSESCLVQKLFVVTAMRTQKEGSSHPRPQYQSLEAILSGGTTEGPKCEAVSRTRFLANGPRESPEDGSAEDVVCCH